MLIQNCPRVWADGDPSIAQQPHVPRIPATEEDKNTCLVLPVLKWLLGEFERGILASIDCDAMNALKRVIRRGKRLLILMNKYYKNKGGDVWLKESELKMIITACNHMHLRLPYWEFMVQRNREYLSWKQATLGVLRRSGGAKVNVDVLDRLVQQYKEYRILSKHGDALKSYLVPIREWIETAQNRLTSMDNGDGVRGHEMTEDEREPLHELLLEFERYTEIITDPPAQYVVLLQRLGISSWINEVCW